MLCNAVKTQLLIPSFVKTTKITSIYKNKGEKTDLENDRGIFGASKVRSIIEKLIYNEDYQEIDAAMSDSNVEGRKERNIRDNLLVIYACINHTIRNKKQLDIQFYDLSKCFDSMWMEESMNDLYDAGVKDRNFAVISLLNDKCEAKIKTPVGDTEKFDMNRIEMQGTVIAPLKCAVQIDTIGKYCYTFNTGLYEYKNSCYVPPLAMIDDLAGISECGNNSLVLNSIINAKIEAKKLQFNIRKCYNMHVGTDKNNCSDLKIHETPMKKIEKHKYLGDIICSSGSNSENINERSKIGFQAISQIKSFMKDVQLGSYSIQVELILRESLFISKILLNSEVWHSVTKV